MVSSPQQDLWFPVLKGLHEGALASIPGALISKRFGRTMTMTLAGTSFVIGGRPEPWSRTYPMIRVPPGIHLLQQWACRFSYTSRGAQDGDAHSRVRTPALVWGQGQGGRALLWMPEL